MFAIGEKNLNMLKTILDSKNEYDFSIKNNQGKNPIMLAEEKDIPELTNYIYDSLDNKISSKNKLKM